MVATTASPAVYTTTPKKVVTTKTIRGVQGAADRWGYVQVTLTVRKTSTRIGRKTTVTRRITSVKVPVYPDHTDRSIFINKQAIPLLVQETLQHQFDINSIDVIGGATATSYGFGQSLQAAFIAAKKF